MVELKLDIPMVEEYIYLLVFLVDQSDVQEQGDDYLFFLYPYNYKF